MARLLNMLNLVLLQLILHADRPSTGALKGVLVSMVRLDELANVEARARHGRASLVKNVFATLAVLVDSMQRKDEGSG